MLKLFKRKETKARTFQGFTREEITTHLNTICDLEQDTSLELTEMEHAALLCAGACISQILGLMDGERVQWDD